MQIFNRKKTQAPPQTNEDISTIEDNLQTDETQGGSDKAADTTIQQTQIGNPRDSVSGNVDKEMHDSETKVSGPSHDNLSVCESDSSEMQTAFMKRMDTLEMCLTTSQDHCAEYFKHIEEKMQWISGQYDKLSKMYDLMTEYKKQYSLAILKMADMYERLEFLRIFAESTFDNETEQNLQLSKKVAAAISSLYKTLISFGVVPIFPSRNAEFNEAEHQIISVVNPESETDLPGHIAECIKMGIQKDNVVAKAAEVTVFKENN